MTASSPVAAKPTIACLIVILAGLGTGVAFAEQAPEEPKVELPPLEVVGTSLERTPLTATTISGKSLSQAGINSAIDLRRVVPNLSQDHAGLRSFSDNYAIRGIGNTEFLSDPAVVLYVDGAPYGSNTTYSTDLLTIDRVDVYRGPQGSRFGKNAAAGVISIRTRQPTDRLGVEGDVSSGAFDTWQYRASAVGPLAKDKISFSLAGQYGVSDGYIQNTTLGTHADEREAFAGRTALHWTPRKDWDATLTATQDRSRDGLGIVSLAGEPHATASEIDGKMDIDANSQALCVGGAVSHLELISVTARREFRVDPFLLDPDFSPLPGNKAEITYAQPQWTQELQVWPIASSTRWSWRAGFFFSTSKTEVGRLVNFVVPGFGSASDAVQYTAGEETYALLGEATYRAGDKLDVTVGLRAENSLRDLHRTHTSSFGAPPPVDADDGFFNLAPKLTLGHRINDQLLLYGSTGLGFKPGGFSGFIDPPASPRFDTERTWANEIGLKSASSNGKVTVDLAMFYYDVTDYQVEQQTPGGVNFTIVNAPSARTLGAELELSARPAARWEYSAMLGYTDARLDRYTDPFSGASFSDVRAPFIADLNGDAAVQYKHASGIFGRIEGVLIGDTFYDAANTQAFQQAAYGLLHVRTGLERGRFAVSLFGENVTDTHFFMKKIPPLNAGAPGRPREFGVMLAAR